MKFIRTGRAWARIFSPAPLAFLLLLAGCGGDVDLDREIDRMIDAEIAFAELSLEQGMKEAFLTYLAEESVLFQPAPTNGREWYEKAAPSEGVLAWRPSCVEIARSGDLSFSTGPWVMRPSRDGNAPAIHGEYITVWSKGEDRLWTVSADGGIAFPGAGLSEKTPLEKRVPVPSAAPAPESDLAGWERDLNDLEKSLGAASIEMGIAGAILSVAAADIRVYRDGSPSATGMSAVREAYGDLHGEFRFDPVKASLSGAGDLGYSWGTFEQIDREREEWEVVMTWSFLHCWRRNDGGEWRLAYDLALPLPEAE